MILFPSQRELDKKISSFHTGTEYTPILVCIHIYVYGYVNRCKRLQRLKTAIYRRHNNLHFVTVSEKSNWATETGRCDEDRVHGIGLTSTQHTPRHVLEWLASPPPSHHHTIITGPVRPIVSASVCQWAAFSFIFMTRRT